jgi:hypothetical protein
MKTIIRLLAFVSIFLITRPAWADIVGYINYTFASGNTLFTSQLDNSPNDLAILFGTTPTEGTTISLWDATTHTFNTATTYDFDLYGGWSANLTLQAGAGYLLNTFAAFTNTFVGTPLNHDGSTFNIGDSLTPPPVYAGADGIYLLGDKTPVVDTGTDIFLNILGRQPNVGEQVITLTGTSTFLGGGSWSGGVPTLNVGDAALLNIGPVPEPSTMALGLLGAALVHVCRRRLQR